MVTLAHFHKARKPYRSMPLELAFGTASKERCTLPRACKRCRQLR